MKRILFLLLLTVSVYGQNPSRFAKIQITGNTNSGTATKVNVQEANGEVNTQAINTGFNKNIGLGGSDVVGANTLLNQYSATPIDWTATTFASGQVVFYAGKQWIARIATVAGDVPSVSSKWEEITFEALANKTITVDSVPTDGSNNAVSSNGVFDALATKAPIVHAHTVSQITDFPTFKTIEGQSIIGTGNIDLDKNSVGLGNVDNTSDLLKPISTATQIALNTKEPAIASGTISQYWRGDKTWQSFPAQATVDATPTDGSNNAVSSNGVFDALATKAPISSVHNPVTIGTANGLSLSTQQLSLGLASSGVTGALSGADWNTFNSKQNAITGLTTNYLPKWNGSGFGNSIVSDMGVVLQISGGVTGYSFVTNDQTPYSFAGGTNSLDAMLYGSGVNKWVTIWTNQTERLRINSRGALLINKTDDDLTNQLQVAGTISASPATTANQVVVKSQLDSFVPSGTVNLTGNQTISGVKTFSNTLIGTTANFSGTVTVPNPINPFNAATKQYVDAVAAVRPYKVYTALLTQTGTNAPTAIVLENTLGGTITWGYNDTGSYSGTLTGAFTTNKTAILIHPCGATVNTPMVIVSSNPLSVNMITISTQLANPTATPVNGYLVGNVVEIRVYN